MKQANRAQRRALATASQVQDGFTNVVSHLGLAGGNNSRFATYAVGKGMLTRNKIQLTGLYAGSWTAGTIIDVVADDMTRAGVTLLNAPDLKEPIEGVFRRTGMWAALNEGIRWARLYGGAAVVIIVAGQDMATPLDPSTISQGQLKGFRVYDRHALTPVANRYIREGVDIGLPELWRMTITQQVIHHTRIIRLIGQKLPPDEAVNENGWGHSVLERLIDRIVAFDTVSGSAAMLVQRAHNRTMSIEDFRGIMASGGAAEAALTRSLDLMKTYQDIAGLTVIDGKDKYEAHTYAFTGLPEVMLQFGAQLAGGSGIPMVRWFGQSPGGMNATGESDFRIYYDTINQKQESDLRAAMARLLELAHWSATGSAPPADMDFLFTSLWQMTAEQKANIGKTVADSVKALVDGGIMTPGIGLREVSETSDITGLGSTITDQEIRDAEDEPPLPTNLELLPAPEADSEQTAPVKTTDSFWRGIFRRKESRT